MQIRQFISQARVNVANADFLRRYSFAAGAVALIAAMTVLVVLKDMVGLFFKPAGASGQAFAMQTGGNGGGQGGGQANAKSKGGQNGGQGGGGQAKGGGNGGGGGALSVDVAPVGTHQFADIVRALGTAQARESITIVSKVTDTISTIRFESGDRVKQGQVLVEMTNLQQAAALKQAAAQLQVDQSSYDRSKELYDKGFNSKATLDVAQANLLRSKAQVDAQRSILADRTIRAPFNGVVGLRIASPGMLAAPGTQIGTLDDTSVIKLDFDVPETELSKMRKGVPLIAKAAAYPDRAFDGKINEVDSRVNTTTRTVRVRALLPNPTGALRPGMLLTVEVRSGVQQGLSVPENAVAESGDTDSVYKVAAGANGGPAHAVETHVTVGRRQDGQIEILSGLKPEDTIIVSGVVQIRDGQPIRVDGAGQGSGQGSGKGKESNAGSGAHKSGGRNHGHG